MKFTRLNIFLITILSFTTELSVTSVSSATEISRADWSIALGLGIFYESGYKGSDEAETKVAPNVEVAWKDRFFIFLDGIGINYYKNDPILLSAIVSQGDERKESHNGSLSGLGNIDASTTLTLGAEIELGPFISIANLTKHIGGTNGIQLTVGLETALPLRMLTGDFDEASMVSMDETEELNLTGPIVIAGLSADWADYDYTSGFFAIDADQSARSGLPQHTTGAGLKSVNFELGVLYPVSRSWIVEGIVGYSKLMGDAEDSPIVKAKDYFFVGGFLNYHF